MMEAGKRFTILDTGEFEDLVAQDAYHQFPVFAQMISNLWVNLDYGVPRIAVYQQEHSLDIIVPTTSDVFSTMAISSKWSPSQLDNRGLLGIGQRTTKLYALVRDFFATVDIKNRLLARTESTAGIQPVEPHNGAVGIEDFQFARSGIRALPPQHHALLTVARASIRRNLIGNAATGELVVPTDNTWKAGLDRHVDNLFRFNQRTISYSR